MSCSSNDARFHVSGIDQVSRGAKAWAVARHGSVEEVSVSALTVRYAPTADVMHITRKSVGYEMTNKWRAAAVAITIALALSPSRASAHGFTASTLEIVHPFFRETPPGAKTGAGYVILRNTGKEADRLTGIETEAAAKVTFHRSLTENNMVRMVPIDDGLEIPAGGEYRLGLDGSHAMLEGLTAPIGLGQVIEGTLIFEKAGRVDITFEVEPVGTTQDDAMTGHENGH